MRPQLSRGPIRDSPHACLYSLLVPVFIGVAASWQRRTPAGSKPGDRVLIEHHVARVWDDGRITIEVSGAPVTIKATLPADHESIRDVLKRPRNAPARPAAHRRLSLCEGHGRRPRLEPQMEGLVILSARALTQGRSKEELFADLISRGCDHDEAAKLIAIAAKRVAERRANRGHDIEPWLY